MNEYYRFLMEFTNGTTPCKKHLVKRYGFDLFNNALQNGYIVEIGKTDIGDPQYAITHLGKEKRDG